MKINRNGHEHPGLHSGDVVALVALGEHEDGGTPGTLALKTALGMSFPKQPALLFLDLRKLNRCSR